LGAWIGLEINLLSFIPLIIRPNNLISSESSLKYFLTQALASIIFLFIVILILSLNNINEFIKIYINLIISSSLIIKIGAAPFHFWFPGVIEGLSWNINLILITWQKIAPLMILSYCLNFNFLYFIIVISILMGSLGGLNQTSLRKLIAFSSINHLGWIIAGIFFRENLWITYFLFYSFLSFRIIFIFNRFKLFHINQIFTLFHNNQIIKFILFLSLLSLGGLPPFLGFFPKWIIIEFILNTNMLFLIILIVTFTLITLFFYIRICYAAFLLNHNENNWLLNNFYFNKNYLICLLLTFISLSGLIVIRFFYWII